MQVQRSYTTRLEFSEPAIVVTITHFPSATGSMPSAAVLGEHLGGSTLHMVDDGEGSPDAMRRLRRLLHALLESAAGCPPQDVESLLGDIRTGEVRLDKDAATQDVLDYLLAAPVVPVEGSWPRMASLAQLALVVGGFGAASLGVATGGDVVDYGAVLVSTGGVVLQVRERARDRDDRAERDRATPPAAGPAEPAGATLSDLLDQLDTSGIDRLGLDKRRSDELRFTAAKRLIETSTFGPSRPADAPQPRGPSAPATPPRRR